MIIKVCERFRESYTCNPFVSSYFFFLLQMILFLILLLFFHLIFHYLLLLALFIHLHVCALFAAWCFMALRKYNVKPLVDWGTLPLERIAYWTINKYVPLASALYSLLSFISFLILLRVLSLPSSSSSWLPMFPVEKQTQAVITCAALDTPIHPPIHLTI